jgi:hypothetical protein
VVVVPKDAALPADVLFLTAENEEGTCYVETMNLDGETNLKIKTARDQTKDLRWETLPDFRGRVECEPPNSRLYQFTGNLLLEPPVAPGGEEIRLPISPASVLLRGCTLRNTERVFGAVIYAGVCLGGGGGVGRARVHQVRGFSCWCSSWSAPGDASTKVEAAHQLLQRHKAAGCCKAGRQSTEPHVCAAYVSAHDLAWGAWSPHPTCPSGEVGALMSPRRMFTHTGRPHVDSVALCKA